MAPGGRSPAEMRNSSILSSSASLIAVLDAADVLEDNWLAWASARFDQVPNISFLRRIGKHRSDSRPSAPGTATPDRAAYPRRAATG